MKVRMITALMAASLILISGQESALAGQPVSSGNELAAVSESPPPSRPTRRIPRIPKPRIKKPQLPGTERVGPGEFPLSSANPFPWTHIEGIWSAEHEDTELYFSFEVSGDYQGRKILKVLQIDVDGGIRAEGFGISIEKNTLVRAAMSGPNGTYMLFVGNYKDPSAPRSRTKTVTVLTIRAFEDITGKNDVHLVMEKLSNVPYYGLCSKDEQN